jgi:hypothetical protein
LPLVCLVVMSTVGSDAELELAVAELAVDEVVELGAEDVLAEAAELDVALLLLLLLPQPATTNPVTATAINAAVIVLALCTMTPEQL